MEIDGDYTMDIDAGENGGENGEEMEQVATEPSIIAGDSPEDIEKNKQDFIWNRYKSRLELPPELEIGEWKKNLWEKFNLYVIIY